MAAFAWWAYAVSQKTVQNCFCQNFVKFPPILIIFGRKMTKRLKLCEVYSFSTSTNLRHHTSLLNANVPNCYITLWLLLLDCSYMHHQFNNSAYNPFNLCTLTYSRQAANATSRLLRHPWKAANRTFRNHSIFWQLVHKFWQFLTILNRTVIGT